MKLPHVGWSEKVYSLEAGDVAALPDYAGETIPAAALPPDEIVVFIRPDGPDALLRGRESVAKAAENPRAEVFVRIAFKPSVAKWNLPFTLVRVLRNRCRYHGTARYHMSARVIREMGLERTIRSLDNPQKRGKTDRRAAVGKLLENIRKNGYDDARPMNVMLCRTGGRKDSLRQGHHRISACLACGVDRVCVEFSAAGALPREIRPRPFRGQLFKRELARFLSGTTGLRIRAFFDVPVKSHVPNFRAACEDGSFVLVKLAPKRVRLPDVDHPLAPRNLFPGRELEFMGRRVYVLEWKRGTAKTLDALTDGELADLAAAEAELCRTLGSHRIHGDYNCNNVLFADGRVSAVLDWEAVRVGSPCEDLVRYALTSVEHLPWFAFLRRRRARVNLVKMARAAAAPAEEWRRAVAAFAARKAARKEQKGRVWWRRVNLAWRQRFYEALTRKLGGCDA